MQLNIKTDYAIRIVLYLADTKKMANATELSEALGIPKTYVPKVVKGLIDSKIVDSREGKGGGDYLVKPPGEISMLSVILCMEPTMKVSKCLEKEEHCCGQTLDSCMIRDYYMEFDRYIREYLQRKTIGDLLKKADM